MKANKPDFASAELQNLKQLFSKFVTVINNASVANKSRCMPWQIGNKMCPIESANYNRMYVPSSTQFDPMGHLTANSNFPVGSLGKENSSRISGNVISQAANKANCLPLQCGDTVFPNDHIRMHVPPSTQFNSNVHSTANSNVPVGSSGKEISLKCDSWTSDTVGNRLSSESEPRATNQLMGIDLPIESVFTDKKLEYLNNNTSQTKLTNYFYYLYDDNYDRADRNDTPMPINDISFQADTSIPINDSSFPAGTPIPNNDSSIPIVHSELASHDNSMRMSVYEPVQAANKVNCLPLQCGDTVFPIDHIRMMHVPPSTQLNWNVHLAANSNVPVGSSGKEISLKCDSWTSGTVGNRDGTVIHMHKRDATTQQQNLEQEADDYDEGIFQSFVENSDDLDDIEFCFEGHNNLPSIIETLAERKSHDTNSSPNNEGPSKCESTPAVARNHLELSAKRLIGSSDNTKMFVGTSDQKGKKLCCPFCYQLVCKLTRHVEAIHSDEAVVQKLIAIPKGSTFKKQRWIIQNEIKVAGLLKWNTDPSVNTTGLFIVSRRPNASLNRKATDFLLCPNCTSFHAIKNLRNHFSRCTGGVLKGARNIKILARVIEGRLSQNASEQLRQVFPVMRDDEIVQLIRYDWLLIAYGNILCMKYGFHFQQNMIRAKLRLAGRVLHALKNINSEVTDFASIFYPKRYKSLIEAIKIVGKFDLVKNEFGAPATASSAITSIKQIGSILKCEYIEKEDSEQVKRTDDFHFLMESQLTSIINKQVKENQLTQKRMKDHKIPSKEDVRLLSVFVNRERNKCLQELTANFSFKSWKKLSELTIASIIVFNRKRVGETQNTIIEDFERRQSIDETTNEDLYAALSEDSKKVAKSYSRMKVRGKKGILNVTVLLDADTTHCIEVMLSHRVEAGVPSYNECLFALPSPTGEKRVKVINACKVLSSLSTMCGAKDPTTLRGTNLRKHFATACMAKELNDDMVGEVAKFLGHRESVHREHYRHNTIDREVVKIAKLLQEAQGMDANEDDASDNESADTDVEDYVTITDSAFKSVSNESRNIHKISGRKQKKNLSEVQPSNSSATSSNPARQKGVRTGKNVQSEKAIAKRMKTERKRPKTKLGVATSSITGSKSAVRKRVKTEKGKHTEKVISKRTKTEGKVSNKLNAATSPVTSSKLAGGKRVRTEEEQIPEQATFKRMKTKG